MVTQEEYPDGSPATVTQAPISILHLSFGQVPPLAESVPQSLEDSVRDLLARRQILQAASDMYVGLRDTCSLDLVIDARDKSIVSSSRVWTWFRKHPGTRHRSYRIAGHVLFWGYDDSYFSLVDEQGRQPCVVCSGVGRWVEKGNAVPCRGCEATGKRLVAEWVPAVLAKLEGGAL